jgi:hypothetical protein
VVASAAVEPGVDAMETVAKRAERSKNDRAYIGVVRYHFAKTDLHSQVAKGDGRTLIPIGGFRLVKGISMNCCLIYQYHVSLAKRSRIGELVAS